MKKNVNLFCAAALIGALCAGFVACNEPKTPEQPEAPEVIGMTPVPAADIPEEVTAFFEKYLPAVSVFYSEIFFVDQDGNKCLMVNSTKELKAIMSYSVDLPEIDFEKCTLVIGQVWMGGTGFTTSNQNLDVWSNKVTLNLRVKRPEGSYTVPRPLYYWGLYPKLPKNAVEVNVVYDANINYEK